MDLSSVTTAKYAICGLGTCLLATEIPLPEPVNAFASMGVAGLSLFLVWWVIAKTIPNMNEQHGQQLKQLADSHTESVKAFTDFLRDGRQK